jgi:ABC-type multidrug transport system permease subunit
MLINIRFRKRALGQHMQPPRQVARSDGLQKQLFIMMFSSIIIFLITTLPLAIYRIVFPKQVLYMTIDEYGLVMSISAGLTWFWGFNYAVSILVKNKKNYI